MDNTLIHKLTQELNAELTELKNTLITVDKDPTQSTDCIGENIKRISCVLQEVKDNNISLWEIHNSQYTLGGLLRVQPLTRI